MYYTVYVPIVESLIPNVRCVMCNNCVDVTTSMNIQFQFQFENSTINVFVLRKKGGNISTTLTERKIL